MAIVMSRSSAGSGFFRAVCQLPRVAMESTTKRAIPPLPQDHLPMNQATQGVVTGSPEDLGHQVSMPGAWLHERQEQSVLETLEESALNMMSWTLFCCCAHMGMKAWTRFPGLTAIFASGTWKRGTNDVVTIGRISEDGYSTLCRGLRVDVEPAALNETEQGAGQDYLPIDSCPSNRHLRGSTTTMHNQRCEPVTVGNVATNDRDPAKTTTLDVVCRDKLELTFGLVASSNADDTTSDVDESGSEDGYDGTEDEGLYGVGTKRAEISPLEEKDEYRVLGRRQDSTLSDTGCPPSLRRARSTGLLRNKHDIFDDDDNEDSYWTEQVNARLSGERDSRRASYRYGWSDVAPWPREGREDETDNWRTRNSQVTQFAVPKKTSDGGQRQTDSDSTKLRRHSSPTLNVDASHSHGASRYVYA